MKVYVVKFCVCDEYGCCEPAGVFSRECDAHAWAIRHDLMHYDENKDNFSIDTDYYQVIEFEIDNPPVWDYW